LSYPIWVVLFTHALYRRRDSIRVPMPDKIARLGNGASLAAGVSLPEIGGRSYTLSFAEGRFPGDERHAITSCCDARDSCIWSSPCRRRSGPDPRLGGSIRSLQRLLFDQMWAAIAADDHPHAVGHSSPPEFLSTRSSAAAVMSARSEAGSCTTSASVNIRGKSYGVA
jgi:hypothetical protein